MFSLLVTLISIALVAALALATLYYGGTAFDQGAIRAQVAKVLAQAQQVSGALELYKAETGAYPTSLDALVTQDYLKSLPVAAITAQPGIAEAWAATATWTLAAPGQPVVVLSPVSPELCVAFNLNQIGQAGILNAAHVSLPLQCAGSSLDALKIISSKAASDLSAVSQDPVAATTLGATVLSPVPATGSADTSIDGWLVLPGTLVTGTPSGATNLTILDDETWLPVTSLEFPSTRIGGASFGVFVDILNTTGAPTTVTKLSVPPPFSIELDSCTGVELAPGDSCYIAMAFSPTAVQSYSGPAYTLQVTAGSTSSAGLLLLGTGRDGPFFESYGTYTSSVAQGASEVSQVTFVNIAGVPVTATSVELPWPYSVVQDHCSGVVVLAGDPCSVTFSFSPLLVGPAPGTLRVLRGTEVLGTYSLNGTAVAGTGSFVLTALDRDYVPLSLWDFGAVALGGSSTSPYIGLQNEGNTSVATGGLSYPSNFILDYSDCTYKTILPGQSCMIQGHMHPANIGQETGELRLTDAAGAILSRVPVTVLGAPALPSGLLFVADAASQTAYAFPPVSLAFLTAYPQVAGVHSFTLKNTATTPVSGFSFNLPFIGDNNGFNYDRAGSSCSRSGLVLQPGESCSMYVVFDMQTLGTKSATLTVTGNKGETASVALTGTIIP